jgi:hypothetical protein
VHAVKLVQAAHFESHYWHTADEFLNREVGQTQVFGTVPLIKVGLHCEHVPVYASQVAQSVAHGVHTLLPGLYWPSGHEVSSTQAPATKA